MPYQPKPHPCSLRPRHAWYRTTRRGQAAIVDPHTHLILAITGPASDPASVRRAVELADLLTVTSAPGFAGVVPTHLDVPGRRWRVDLHVLGGGVTFFGDSPAEALHTAAEWLHGPAPVEVEA